MTIDSDRPDGPNAEVFVPTPDAPVDVERGDGGTTYDFDPDAPGSEPNPNPDNYRSETEIENETTNDPEGDSGGSGDTGGDDGGGDDGD